MILCKDVKNPHVKTNKRFNKNKTSYKGGFRHNKSKRNSRGKKKSLFERIDVSRFISKATIVEKEEIYIPTHTFSDFQIDQKLKTNIGNKGYVYPSPIQDRAIPHALTGRDILGIANTGTGKTAGFLIPIINKIIKDDKETAIIIAPTRELAIQIEKEFVSFTKGMKIFSCICVGGAPINGQIRNLRRGCRTSSDGCFNDQTSRGSRAAAATKMSVHCFGVGTGVMLVRMLLDSGLSRSIKSQYFHLL
jgi:ATP-dependent RNA helicase RhlE